MNNATEVNDLLQRLIGWSVWRCSVDYQFRLLLFGDQDDPSAELVIETMFRYIDPEGIVHQLVPGESPEKLGTALRLFGQKCSEASAYGDGRLRLAFTDGSRVEVDPDPSFEAWQIPQLRIICLPGGGVA